MKKKEKRKLELLEQQARQLQEMDAGDGDSTAATEAVSSKVLVINIVVIAWR